MQPEPMTDPSLRSKLAQFWQKLGYMLSAGVPLSEALHAIMVEMRDQEIAPIVAKLKAEIEKGRPLSRALEALPDASLGHRYADFMRAVRSRPTV